MSDQFLGEIRLFACNFAPTGWALCNGQLLAISQFSALFSLLGTIYGGDGKSTFQLPNLQGRIPVNQGQGPGLSNYVLGEIDGSPSVTLNQSEMAAHNHLLNADKDIATSNSPAGAIYMKGHYVDGTVSGQVLGYSAQRPTTNMKATALGLIGGNQPHNNMMPYLTLNFCIALTGVFPQRG
jgi:microcystin-dependent protein